MIASFKVVSVNQIPNIVRKINDSLAKNIQLKISLEQYKKQRSLPANNLYWMWLEQIATHCSQRFDQEYSKEDMHDLMRHKFLGYHQHKKIGNTQIPLQLKTTTNLNSSEFNFYLEKIDAWAAKNGILLKHPADSEYQNYINEQEQ